MLGIFGGFFTLLILVFLTAGAAIGISLLVIIQNKKKMIYKQENQEQVYVENIYEDNKGCHLQIRDNQGQKAFFPIGREAIDKLAPGENCLIVRKKGKLLSWASLKEREKEFFTGTNSNHPTMKITADAPLFSLSISSKSNIKASLEEVLEYMDRITENKTDHFVAIDDERGRYLEISGTGKDRFLSIRLIEDKETHWLQKCNVAIAKSLIRDFYSGEKLASKPGFSREE